MKHKALSMILVCAAGFLFNNSLTAEPPNDLVGKKLGKIIPKLSLTKVRFEDAVQMVQTLTDANIDVDWKMLEADCPDIKGKVISVEAKNVTLRRAMELILREAEEPGSMSPAIFLDKGEVRITTRDVVNSITTTKMYYIADIAPALSIATDVEYSSIIMSFPRLDALPYCHKETDEAVCGCALPNSNRLRQCITITVDRESWYPNGNGQFMDFMGSLLITQTPTNHEEIQRLLQTFRRDLAARKLTIGLTVIREKEHNGAFCELKDVLRKGEDYQPVLTRMEKEDTISLDRSGTTTAWLGIPCTTRSGYERTVFSPSLAGEKESILRDRTATGYEIHILPVSRQNGGIVFNVDCNSAWLNGEEDPYRNTPETNTGIHARENTFDVTIRYGETKLFPVIPSGARDGGVKVLLWLPKQPHPKKGRSHQPRRNAQIPTTHPSR